MATRKRKITKRSGLTLGEVLLGALIALSVVWIGFKVLPQPQRRRGGGVAQNNRQIALASLMYAGDNDDVLPVTANGWLSRIQNRKQGQRTISCPGPGTEEGFVPDAAGAEPTLAWPQLLMPYIKSRQLFVDPYRGDVNNIWAKDALYPGDPGYDPAGATLRNQARFPMYGYNYMFLSPLKVPKNKVDAADPAAYAAGESHKTEEPDDPSGTIMFVTSQRTLSDTSRGFFAVNAPGMWRTFDRNLGDAAMDKKGHIAFWTGGAGSGDWIGTATACEDDASHCAHPQTSQGFAYMLSSSGGSSQGRLIRPGADATFVDGHVKFMRDADLAAGTNYLTASATSPNLGTVITDPKHYLWDLK